MISVYLAIITTFKTQHHASTHMDERHYGCICTLETFDILWLRKFRFRFLGYLQFSICSTQNRSSQNEHRRLVRQTMLYSALLKSSPILNVTSEQGNKSKSSQKQNRMQLFCITDIVFQFPFAKTLARTPVNLRLIQ